MDPSPKKRKHNENGIIAITPTPTLTPDDASKVLASFTQDQLLLIVKSALGRGDPTILHDVRAIADRDPSQRKLFIRGLGYNTTSDSLRAAFAPFGDLEEAVIIPDKATGRSKGYGFITFRHIDGAVLALKEPSKKIDDRITVVQLASTGNTGIAAAPGPAPDLATRKIYVGNVPPDMNSDRLLAHFAAYGEIEEGPLGLDKQTGKFRGYALFVYKSAEAARATLVDPTKTIDGHHLVCKLANTGRPGAFATPVDAGIGTQLSLPSQFGVPAGAQPFAGLPGSGGIGLHHPLGSSLQPFGVGAPGLSSAGSQMPSSLGGSGAGSYGGFGGSYGPSSQYGGLGSGGYGGLGMGPSLYLPPGSVGMPSGGYPESGHYSLSSSAYQSQNHPQAGSPGRKYPTAGGMYPTMPPYF